MASKMIDLRRSNNVGRYTIFLRYLWSLILYIWLWLFIKKKYIWLWSDKVLVTVVAVIWLSFEFSGLNKIKSGSPVNEEVSPIVSWLHLVVLQKEEKGSPVNKEVITITFSVGFHF